MTYSNYLNSSTGLCSSSVVQTDNNKTKEEHSSVDDTIQIKLNKDKINTILKKHGIENRFDIISNIINDELSDDYLLSLKDKDIELIQKCLEKAIKECQSSKPDEPNIIEKAREYYFLAKNGCNIDNNAEEEPADINGIIKKVLGDKENLESLPETEKQNAIKKYFEDKLNEYKKQGKINPEEELRKDFTKLLVVLPDKDKKLLLKVVLEVFTTDSVVSQLFESFKNNELRMKVADSITYDEYKKLNSAQQTEITRYMSAPGTEKLLSELEKKAQDYYFINRNVLDQIYKKDESELTDEERKIKSEYEKLAKIISNTHEGILGNKNLNDENKEKLTERIINIFEGTPYQETYIKNLAESLSKSELAAKYKDILDKSTQNKFSEELSKIDEKSATDESGNFKTAPAEVIAKSKEKIQTIELAITENAPLSASVDKTTVKDVSKVTEEAVVIDYEAITGNDSVEIIKDIFAGKIKISEYLEKAAIKQYKLMNSTLQGTIIFKASGKFFNELLEYAKSPEKLLATGKKKNYYTTQLVKEEIEERRDDVA